MSFLSNAPDDQLALIGCGAALAVSFGLMFVSFYIGNARQASASAKTTPSIRMQDRRGGSQTNRDTKAA